MDDRKRKATEDWADAFLDEHRTAPRPDREADREAAARALRDLPRITRWMLTHGGREPDLEVIERMQRANRRGSALQKWDMIVTVAGLVLLCLGAAVWFSVL